MRPRRSYPTEVLRPWLGAALAVGVICSLGDARGQSLSQVDSLRDAKGRVQAYSDGYRVYSVDHRALEGEPGKLAPGLRPVTLPQAGNPSRFHLLQVDSSGKVLSARIVELSTDKTRVVASSVPPEAFELVKKGQEQTLVLREKGRAVAYSLSQPLRQPRVLSERALSRLKAQAQLGTLAGKNLGPQALLPHSSPQYQAPPQAASFGQELPVSSTTFQGALASGLPSLGERKAIAHPAAHWHFGDGGQIVFTSGGPVASGRSKLRQQEGSSSLSDTQGNLIAYTDGGTVIESGDRALQASQGRSLGGNPSSTQSALLIPKPGKENQVVLLSLDQGGYTGPSAGLIYSEVGKSQEGSASVGREEWSILAQRERLPVSRQLTEKLAAVHHANGRDIWVLTHRTFSDEFAAYLLTEQGLSTEPIVSRSGSVHSCLDDGSIGQMKCSPDGRWVAAAIPNTNQVELHRFDARTGRVFEGIALPQDSAVGRIQLPYGIEFSKDGGQLFVASLLENAVWVYPISEQGKKPSATKLVGSTRGLTAGSLQLGPDGRVYVALTDGPAGAGSRQVGAVERTATGSWAYRDSSVVLPAEQRCRLGLPGFVASVFAEPKVDFEASPLCAGDATRFVNWSTPSERKSQARWRWSFGDPSSETDTSSAEEPTYQYREPGVYSVTLEAVLAGRRDSLTRQVRIWSKPLVELGPNQTLPADGSALRIVLATDPGVAYLWEDGSTAATREFHRPGLVWVQAMRGACVARDTLRILPRAQGSVVSGSPSQVIQDDLASSEGIESAASEQATGESNLASVPGALSLFSSIQVKPVLSLLPTMGIAGVGYAPMGGFTNERSFAHTPLFVMPRLSLQIAPQLGLLFTPVFRKKR